MLLIQFFIPGALPVIESLSGGLESFPYLVIDFGARESQLLPAVHQLLHLDAAHFPLARVRDFLGLFDQLFFGKLIFGIVLQTADALGILFHSPGKTLVQADLFRHTKGFDLLPFLFDRRKSLGSSGIILQIVKSLVHKCPLLTDGLLNLRKDRFAMVFSGFFRSSFGRGFFPCEHLINIFQFDTCPNAMAVIIIIRVELLRHCRISFRIYRSVDYLCDLRSAGSVFLCSYFCVLVVKIRDLRPGFHGVPRFSIRFEFVIELLKINKALHLYVTP